MTYTIDTVQEQRRVVLAMSDYYDKFGVIKLITLNRVDKERFMGQISARRMKEFWPRAAFMLMEQPDENEGDENKSDEREGEKEDDPDDGLQSPIDWDKIIVSDPEPNNE